MNEFYTEGRIAADHCKSAEDCPYSLEAEYAKRMLWFDGFKDQFMESVTYGTQYTVTGARKSQKQRRLELADRPRRWKEREERLAKLGIA